MSVDLKKLQVSFNVWLAAHPWLAGLVAVVEAAVISTIYDAVTDPGFSMTRYTAKQLVHTIALSAFIAARNYFRQSPIQLAVVSKPGSGDPAQLAAGTTPTPKP